MVKLPFCFFVMPFWPELNYFFLYLQDHLQKHHGMRVQRGDYQILTQSINQKILRQITAADFLIADITGNNPNVFYEVGVAHALFKPVIFLTQGEPKDVPVDVRLYELIVYDLDRHEEFLLKLDHAVADTPVFAKQYQELYNEAHMIFTSFNRKWNSAYEFVESREFQSRVMLTGGTGTIPASNTRSDRERRLLAMIVRRNSDITVMERITTWEAEKSSEPEKGSGVIDSLYRPSTG